MNKRGTEREHNGNVLGDKEFERGGRKFFDGAKLIRFAFPTATSLRFRLDETPQQHPLITVRIGMCGCIATSVARFDSEKRQPKAQIDVFTPGHNPERAYKEIASFSAGGKPFDESKAHASFISQAKKMGADGIILKPTTSGAHTGGFGLEELGFTAVAIVYK